MNENTHQDNNGIMKRFAIIATLAALAAVCISCAAIGSPEPGGASSAPNSYKALDLPTKSSTYV